MDTHQSSAAGGNRHLFVFGILALTICAGELALCFTGPLAFVQKPTLVLFPLFTSGLTSDQADKADRFVERQLALTRSYSIVSHRFIVEYYVRTDPDFDKAKMRPVDHAAARATARELGLKQFAIGWITCAASGCNLSVSICDSASDNVLRRGDFVARDFEGLLKGVGTDGTPLDFRGSLASSTRGMGPAEYLVLALFVLQAFVGMMALFGKEPGLLIEITMASASVLFLFAYIYAANANMDYMQRYIAATGQLHLAESTTAERAQALARYAPSVLLFAAYWVLRALRAGPSSRDAVGSGGRSRLYRVVGRWSVPWTILSACLFGFSFSSPLSLDGVGALAWFALVPLFLVLATCEPRKAVFHGVYFGILQGLIVNHWHATYDYVTLHMVCIAIVVEYLLFMILLVGLLRASGKWGFITAPLAWVFFDWCRSLGALGYPWGLAGATQYRALPLIQISSITGIWGVDFLVLFANASIAWWVMGRVLGWSWGQSFRRRDQPRNLHGALRSALPLAVCGAVLFLCLAAGSAILASTRSRLAAASPKDSMTVVLVQPNTDPRKSEYTDNLDQLTGLTNEAFVRLGAKPDLVAWPEGAIMLDIGYWTDPSRKGSYWGGVVRQFLDYQRGLGTWLATGTQDHGIATELGKPVAKDFNSSMLLDPGGNVRGMYHKIHLVPFGEYFPLSKERFAGLYSLFQKYDISDWGIGEARVLFNHPKARFCTPICFEDVFPDDVRRSVLPGADIILNMSNDYWSLSPVEGRQHGILALFRAVENHRPLLRATESGYTVSIDPTGRIEPGSPQPYTAGYLIATVPLVKLPLTIYTRWGDWFPALAGALVVLSLAGWAIIRWGSVRDRIGAISNVKEEKS